MREAQRLLRIAKTLVAGSSVGSILQRYAISVDELNKVYDQLPSRAKGWSDDRRRDLKDMMSSRQSNYVWVTERETMRGGYIETLTGGPSLSQAEGRKEITGEEFLEML